MQTREIFDTGAPASGAQVADALERLAAEALPFLQAIPLPEFFAAQRRTRDSAEAPDRWSPAEHVRHLAKSNFPVAKALRQPGFVLFLLFGPARQGSRSYVELRETYQRRLAQGADAGRFAPSPQPPPADPAQSRVTILAKWRASVEQLRLLIPARNEAALDRYRLPHPLLGKLTLREMAYFTLYHNAHHLRLLAGRLRESAGGVQP